MRWSDDRCVRLRLVCQCEIDSSSKQGFEEEIIKCCFRLCNLSPALQKGAASSAPISAKAQTQNKASSAIKVWQVIIKSNNSAPSSIIRT